MNNLNSRNDLIYELNKTFSLSENNNNNINDNNNINTILNKSLSDKIMNNITLWYCNSNSGNFIINGKFYRLHRKS